MCIFQHVTVEVHADVPMMNITFYPNTDVINVYYISARDSGGARRRSHDERRNDVTHDEYNILP